MAQDVDSRMLTSHQTLGELASLQQAVHQHVVSTKWSNVCMRMLDANVTRFLQSQVLSLAHTIQHNIL